MKKQNLHVRATTKLKKQNKSTITDLRVIVTSLAVSVSDVVLNLLVALFTGSTAVLSQSFQGFSDVTTTAILFLGVRRSRKEADSQHPLGYGREIFFWALLSAIIMFFGSGALSLYFGLQQFLNPEPLKHMQVALAMLIFGLSTNLYAFSRSVQLFRLQTSGSSWWQRVRNSGMVDTKITFMVDLLGSTAALIGLISVIAYLITGYGSIDGLGAMAVGLATMTGAVVVMIDVHGLIIGRSASPEIQNKITKSALSVNGVEKVLDIYAFYIGSNRLFAVLEVHLSDNFTTDEIEKISDEIKNRLSVAVPKLHRVQIEVETPDYELLDREQNQ